MAKKRLSDLYKRTQLVTFEDDGEELSVLVCKLNSAELDQARKAADAARSRVFTIRRDPQSDEYMALWAEVCDLGRQDLIDRLVANAQVEHDPVAEAEAAAEEEWSKDNYLDGLRTAWEEELKDVWADEETRTEESSRVHAELERFNAQVDELVEAHVAGIRAQLDQLNDERLQDKVFDTVLEARGNLEWLSTFRRLELFLCVRDPEDRRTYYFESPNELLELEPEVVNRLYTTLRDISVEVVEGKESQASTSS